MAGSGVGESVVTRLIGSSFVNRFTCHRAPRRPGIVTASVTAVSDLSGFNRRERTQHPASPHRRITALLHVTVGNYDSDSLIEVLGELRRFLGGEKATLLWDGLPSHRSRAMRA